MTPHYYLSFYCFSC